MEQDQPSHDEYRGDEVSDERAPVDRPTLRGKDALDRDADQETTAQQRQRSRVAQNAQQHDDGEQDHLEQQQERVSGQLGRERLREVADYVLDILDADRHAYGPRSDAQRRALFRAHRAM